MEGSTQEEWCAFDFQVVLNCTSVCYAYEFFSCNCGGDEKRGKSSRSSSDCRSPTIGALLGSRPEEVVGLHVICILGHGIEAGLLGRKRRTCPEPHQVRPTISKNCSTHRQI